MTVAGTITPEPDRLGAAATAPGQDVSITSGFVDFMHARRCFDHWRRGVEDNKEAPETVRDFFGIHPPRHWIKAAFQWSVTPTPDDDMNHSDRACRLQWWSDLDEQWIVQLAEFEEGAQG